MMKSCLFALAGALMVAPEASAQVAVNFEGLWSARQQFGPAIGGTLLILDRGGGLHADISGFSVPVQRQGQRLSFALPDAKGDFRGIISGNQVRGQWIQAQTVNTGSRLSTPLILTADGDGRWRGEVVPLDDSLTYFLPVARTADGKWATYLRNPDRNFGVFLRVSRLEAEGQAIRLLGNRRGSKEESVLATGWRDSETGAMSIALPRGTYSFMPDKQETSAFYPRARAGERYAYKPPIAFRDGWPVSSLEAVGISREPIERFVQMLIDRKMEEVGTSQLHSLLIARNGKLVLEEYFHGHNRDMPHDLRSASKSWTAVLIGAAMQAGVPISIDTPLYQTMLGTVPADLDPRKKAVTLEHLITMTAGFDCDDSGDRPGDEDVFQDQDKEPNWYRYMLNVPMTWNSGDQIVYCSGKPNLAAGMLEKVASEPLPELFDRLVGRPMQMDRYHLFLQPTGEAYGGGGHRFRPRDFLKLAQLMMDDGRWQGRQIVSRDWARKSTEALRVLSPKSGQTYGYLWNSVSYPYRGRKVHAFFAAGNGGQIFMGIPELDLAIGFTGGNYADAALFVPQRVFVPEHLLPAVR
jgi:CubicO group peptidase (beta-lactamase class C family)